MEDLSVDNIMSIEGIENFSLDDGDSFMVETNEPKEEQKDKKEANITEKIDVDSLENDDDDDEESSESVGNEENNEEKEDTSTEDEGTSPNIYSSIANVLKVDGILPDLEDADLKKIGDADQLLDMVEKATEKRIQDAFDERQKRIDAALNAGVEPDVVRQYERTLQYLDGITEDDIKDESDKGETLRKQLIYQDLINNGYSQKEAQEEVDEIFEDGTDQRRALRALNSNKKFFKKGYDTVVEESRRKVQEAEDLKKKRMDDLKKAFDAEEIFGQKIDKVSRKKMYESITKPVYKDPETGELFTAIQKFEKENKVDFMKIIGYFFERTDGFKNLDKIIQPEVSKTKRKAAKQFEDAINGTSRHSDGSFKFVSNHNPDSYIGAFDLDV